MSKKGAAFLVAILAMAVAVGAFALFGPDDQAEKRLPSSESEQRRNSTLTPASVAPSLEVSEPQASPQPPPAPPGSRNFEVWNGPDDAVATWDSAKCGQVLRLGAQLYLPGGKVAKLPEGVGKLGYSLGSRELWGDRGTPRTLYVTTDKGKSFVEWLSTDQEC